MPLARDRGGRHAAVRWGRPSRFVAWIRGGVKWTPSAVTSRQRYIRTKAPSSARNVMYAFRPSLKALGGAPPESEGVSAWNLSHQSNQVSVAQCPSPQATRNSEGWLQLYHRHQDWRIPYRSSGHSRWRGIRQGHVGLTVPSQGVVGKCLGTANGTSSSLRNNRVEASL